MVESIKYNEKMEQGKKDLVVQEKEKGSKLSV